jgi:microcompartment protein CcmL/EutN
MQGKALGLIETLGLVGALEAADAAVKAAEVDLLGYTLARGGLVTIWLAGQVAAVKAAVEAGQASAGRVGKVVAGHVIPRPRDEIWNLDSLEKRKPVVSATAEQSGAAGAAEQPEAAEAKEEPAAEDLSGVSGEPAAVNGTGVPGREETLPPAALPDREEAGQAPTCNMCGDIKCPRHKGEPRAKCIHYSENGLF